MKSVSFDIYSSCYSARRKEQFPRKFATPTSSRSKSTDYSDCNNYRGISPQYHWKGLCPCSVKQLRWEGVYPWGTVRVQSRKVNNWHDLFTEEAVGKMSCAEKTLLLPLLTWPRPSTQSSGRAYPISYRRLDAPTSSKGWQRFPWTNRPVRRLNLSPLPNQERSETGLCTCSHTSQHLFLLLVLSYAFSHSVDGVYLHSRSDVNLLNLARLQVKTKVRKVLISEMVFANDAVLTAHTKGASKRFISSFAHACCEFGLIISPKKTRILGRDVSSSRWWRTSLT